jgi:crotonobetainyl-CoA:carnitine CoA-transferase CaiB-like acyl-CoA transferase
MSETKGALSGIRVLDLTRILAGPSCTQILGDRGADVIKIERPGSGDDTRRWGPPFAKTPDGEDTQESAYYLCANRNKRSVTVDMSKPEGVAILKRLLKDCQILTENFKTGGLKKYGLDYESLKDEFPDLIYCSITGFGQTGPYSARPGYDYLAQGMGGFMSITGEPDGQPMKAGISIADIMTGMYATVSVLAALNHRNVTGEGQHLDLCLLDSMIATMTFEASNYLSSGKLPTRLGNAHPNVVPYQVVPTKDGHVIIASGNEDQFKRFCEFSGSEEWMTDPRFETNSLRIQNRTEFVPLLYGVMAQKTSQEWLEGLEGVGVPCGPVNTLEQVFNDPQVLSRDMKVEIPHPTAGSVTVPGSPINMSKTPVQYRRAPPLVGQHTDEVLGELLDMSTEERDALREKGLI